MDQKDRPHPYFNHMKIGNSRLPPFPSATGVKVRGLLPAVLLLSLFLLVSVPQSGEKVIGFREDFNDLANWKPYLFSNIERHSRYSAEREGETIYLRAESDGSASAILWKESFNVYEYPHARWRWKIEKIYEKGDAKSKTGDDYPIRVYLIFEKKALLGLISLPTSLNYIWANRAYGEKIIPNAYTGRSMMVLLEEGGDKAGQWITEETNIIEDYRRAFGEDPPKRATIAIMNDSDNTGASSVSYVDFIEIFRR
jgi:hypothetical protein